MNYSCEGCGAKCCKNLVDVTEADAFIASSFLTCIKDVAIEFLRDKDSAVPLKDGRILVQPALLKGEDGDYRFNVFHKNEIGGYSTKFNFVKNDASRCACIFLTDQNKCFLQDESVKLGFGPWAAKPIPCIAFPLVENPDLSQGGYVPILKIDKSCAPQGLKRYITLVENHYCKKDGDVADLVKVNKIQEEFEYRNNKLRSYLCGVHAAINNRSPISRLWDAGIGFDGSPLPCRELGKKSPLRKAAWREVVGRFLALDKWWLIVPAMIVICILIAKI